MTDPPDRPSEDATEALLVEYLMALEAGDRPSADAFAARLDDGPQRARFRALVDAASWARGRFPERARAEQILAGRYRLVHELGHGGFGTVWAAVDERLDDRPVAVKLLNDPGTADDAHAVLERERKALGLVDHPGVVGIHDVGEHDGRPFLVMDRVDGTPLDAVIAAVRAATPRGASPSLDALRDAIRRPLTPGREDLVGDGYWRTTARIVAAMLRALEAAHARGIVHRDLKPQNVMLQGGGQPVLLDFGIAALREGTSGLVTGRLIGTPIYVAPEQINTRRLGADPLTDVYQIGLILYEMLALRPAFDPELDVTSTLHAIGQGDVTPPRAIEPGVPSTLEAVCMRAIRTDPRLRYADAVSFRHDLDACARGEDPSAPEGAIAPPPAQLAADDRFEVREELHRGPRVVRWRAFDRVLECEVVLEQPGEAIAARLGSSAGVRALREARALAKVEHPGIARLREVAWRDGLPLLVLEARAGETLADTLARRGRLAPDEVVRLGRELAEATQAIHAAGVVHRGISANNVRIDSSTGCAILGGFGFAKPFEGGEALSSIDHGLRAGGEVASRGLPDYAAPEQLTGQSADARADVFALGCLLYRCATGEEAFAPDQIEWTAPKSIRETVPDAPRALETTIDRCLLRSPAARYPTMLAVREALNTPAEAPVRSWSSPFVIAALVFAVSTLILAFALGAFDREPPATDSARGSGTEVAREEVSYAPRYAASRAVLVGIDYRDHPHFDALRNAERDVRAVEAALLELGWSNRNVRTLTGSSGDATSQTIVDALRETLNGAEADDQVFVYLAGHGELQENDPRSGYFVALDGGSRETKTRWVRFSELQNLLSHTRAKHVLVALDCCHAGAATLRSGRSPRPRTPKERPVSLVEQELLTRRARVWLTSALADETATDGDGQHSPFAAGLLAALNNARNRPVTSGHVHALVWAELAEQRAAQRCRLATDPTGAEFVFRKR